MTFWHRAGGWILCVLLASQALAQTSSVDSPLLRLGNDQISLGLKTDSGAAIAWVSAGKDAPNLVNAFDRGRLIQQSYYGQTDGSTWNKQPWRWNPVQGGDWLGNSSRLLQLRLQGEAAYAKTLPKHWASGKDIESASMEQWITLHGPVAHIKYRFEHHGPVDHPPHHQELPAVFVTPKLRNLVLYDGDRPWTEDLISRSIPGWPNEYRKPTERWAAYVDDADEGIGVYVPKADELTCYRYGRSESAKDACSYLAPLATFAITRDFVWEYDVYVTVGKLSEIRQRFAVLAKQASQEVAR